MARTASDQNKVLGANYVAEFFLEIKELTIQYANYKNMSLEIEYQTSITKPGDDVKIDSDQINNARVGIHNIRFYSHKVFVHFSTLTTILNLPGTLTDPINKAYDAINDPRKPMPDIVDIEKFVIGVNSILTNNIISNLLQTSQDVLSSIIR